MNPPPPPSDYLFSTLAPDRAEVAATRASRRRVHAADTLIKSAGHCLMAFALQGYERLDVHLPDTQPFVADAVRIPMPTASVEISGAQSLRERADAVLWIKSQMARLGLTYEKLLAAGCFALPDIAGGPASAVIRFRDADGHAWNGVGDLPDWLQRAVNAGQSIEHFRIGRKK